MRKIFISLLLISNSIVAQTSMHKMADGLIENQDLFNRKMRDSVSCFRIPALLTAKNGDVLAAIDERVTSCGDLRGCKNINIALRRSSDNGANWTPIEIIIDFAWGESASDPSMILDEETGTIFLFYNYMNLETEPDVYYLHVIKSTDHGKTWSEPEDITSQISKPEWHSDFKFITSGRGIQTKSGRLLHCMVNLDNGMHLFGSDDHGSTWFLIDTPVTPANESKVIELVDGSLMINARVNNKKGMRYVHLSENDGKTWVTRAEPTLIDPGCNASIIRYTSKKDGYKKNRLLFANAAMKEGRKNMTVRISYDEGKTWSEGKTIYTGKSAYSTLTKLANGEIGLLFEQDGYTKNPFVSFSLEWLTNGKDKYKKPKKIR